MSIITRSASRVFACMLVASSVYLSSCGDSSEPAVPGSLEIVTGAGQSAVAGSAVPIAPSVRLVSTRGKPLAGAQVTFTSSEDGVVSPAHQVTDAQGVATLSSWTLPKRAGSHQLTVSSTGVAPLVIQATATAGTAAKLTRASPEVQDGTVATDVASSPAVLVSDANDNPIAGVTVNFSVSGNGAVANASAVSDADGIARSGGWTLGTLAGEQTLHANIPDVAAVAPIRFLARAHASVATRLAVLTEPSTTAGSGAPLQVQPVVEVQDVFGNHVRSAAVPVTAALAPGSTHTLSGTLTIFSTEGRASFTDLVVTGIGNVQLRFTASGLAETTSAAFNVSQIAQCAGAVRTLDFALGESHRFLTTAQQAPFCFDFALGTNAGQQYLVQIENLSMAGNSDSGVFPGVALSQSGLTMSVRTGALPPSDSPVTTQRAQLPERAVHSWDFGGGEIYEIEPHAPADGARAYVKRGDLLLDTSAGATDVVVGDTIVAELVGIPRLGIRDGPQRAVVKYTTADLIIAEDVRLATLTRQGGGSNTPLTLAEMQAIASDYARYAKVQADRFFGGRYNAAIEASGGRPIAIHSLMYADNIWGYTFPDGNYFVWDFWVGTNGSVRGPNQQVERNSNNLFMHEIAHMRHAGLSDRAHKAWRGNRWVIEGFARATERWPIAMRLLGSVTPSRINNVVLPSYPLSSLNTLEDVPVYTQASASLYTGYAASSYVFDYFADQVARTSGSDWMSALAEFVLDAGNEAALNEVISRYLPGLDFGTLLTRARIAFYTDDWPGLPDWTQYHQFQLRASRTTQNPQLDPRNLWL